MVVVFALFAVNRLKEFHIRVGSSFDASNTTTFDPTLFSICHYQEERVCEGETRTFYCDGDLEGRYVTIHYASTRHEFLTLCEVEIYDHLEPTGEVWCCVGKVYRRWVVCVCVCVCV